MANSAPVVDLGKKRKHEESSEAVSKHSDSESDSDSDFACEAPESGNTCSTLSDGRLQSGIQPFTSSSGVYVSSTKEASSDRAVQNSLPTNHVSEASGNDSESDSDGEEAAQVEEVEPAVSSAEPAVSSAEPAISSASVTLSSGKTVFKRWNTWDSFLKYVKHLKDKGSGDASNTRKCVYHDQLRFLQKVFDERPTDATLPLGTINVKTQDTLSVAHTLISPNNPTSTRKRKRMDEVEDNIIKALEPNENSHPFLQGFLPTVHHFYEEEAFKFQMKGLQSISKIKEKRLDPSTPTLGKVIDILSELSTQQPVTRYAPRHSVPITTLPVPSPASIHTCAAIASAADILASLHSYFLSEPRVPPYVQSLPLIRSLCN